MPSAPVPTFSIVIPIHNEAGYVSGAVEELVGELSSVPGRCSVLLAENGSTDDTLRVAGDLAARYPEVDVIDLPNADYGGAMRAGFLEATGDWVVNFDIDYFSATFLRTVEEVGSDADVVLASKRVAGADDRRSLFRRLATSVFNILLRLVLSSGVSDTHGMKALRREVVATVAPAVVSRQDLFDTELVVRAERAGYRIVEVPATVEERRATKSSLVKRVPRTLRGVWMIRRQLRSERTG